MEYKASLWQKIQCHYIMFMQRFGFFPNHLVMPDYFVGIITEDTKFTVTPQLKKAVNDLKNTCNKINKRSKTWAKQNKQIKKNMAKVKMDLATLKK